MITDRSSNATRSTLLQHASQRDARGWREVVDLYGPLVAHWYRRCSLDVHFSADLVQDVFASVAISLDQLSPQRTSEFFRAWSWTITRDKLRDHFRRNVRSAAGSEGWTAMGLIQQIIDPFGAADDEPTGDLQLQRRTSRALTQVQSEFESRTWQAFWRSVVDGIATSEVAKELDMSEATVRKSRSRILRRLRQQLRDVIQRRAAGTGKLNSACTCSSSLNDSIVSKQLMTRNCHSSCLHPINSSPLNHASNASSQCWPICSMMSTV